MKEPVKPHKRSSLPDLAIEQQPCTESETNAVSAGSHILLGISPDDSDPDEEILAATHNNIVPQERN